MQFRPHRLGALIVALAGTALAGCESEGFINQVPLTPVVAMRDECDPATFNAALGPGTCTRQGGVTYTQFSDELATTRRVASWYFDPTALTVRLGQNISAVNTGGEAHTFTHVEVYGGGIFPELNIASGNPIAAPECLRLSPIGYVAPGTTFTTSETTTVGMTRYQCCIHPWMRTAVNVAP